MFDFLEAISTARVKKLFETKDVHLFVGDEVEVMSKSDNGKVSEFEVCQKQII